MARPNWRLRPLKLSHWLRACTAAILVLFIGGVVLVERNGQEGALLHAEEQATTLAHSLSQHAGDTFQMGDLALVSLARLLGTEPPTRSKLNAVSLDMSELLLRVPRIHSLDYFEESGWRLASSRQASSTTLNQSRSRFSAFTSSIQRPACSSGRRCAPMGRALG